MRTRFRVMLWVRPKHHAHHGKHNTALREGTTIARLERDREQQRELTTQERIHLWASLALLFGLMLIGLVVVVAVWPH